MAFNVHTAIGCCWIALGILWAVSAFISKPTERSQSIGDRAVHIGLALLGGLLIGGFFIPSSWMLGSWLNDRFIPHTPAVEYVGFAITLAGVLFAAWARLTLGTNWSGRATVKSDHELIVRGPYSLARHPIYTGLLLALAGTMIELDRWRCLFGFAIILCALAVKMRQEERLMLETFLRQYPDYRRRVKALVPFVF
jgi:protein-S-isoprenylcysteine O-methyltransferase Ste14